MATSAIEECTSETHKVVSEAEWLTARLELLRKEKELTRARDAVSTARRELPWVRVKKEYVFDTVDGKKTLTELFGGRSQLIMYHFMWRKDLGEGCDGCSFLSDHLDGANLHLKHHDVSLVVVSRAPLEVLQAFRKRMEWKFDWVSSEGIEFNYDYHVSFHPEELAKGEVFYNYRMIKASIEELPGISVFLKTDAGEVFHTYSSYARGSEEVLGAYMFLDLTPKGRNETDPEGKMMGWVRHHDRYPGEQGAVQAAACCSADNSKQL